MEKVNPIDNLDQSSSLSSSSSSSSVTTKAELHNVFNHYQTHHKYNKTILHCSDDNLEEREYENIRNYHNCSNSNSNNNNNNDDDDDDIDKHLTNNDIDLNQYDDVCDKDKSILINDMKEPRETLIITAVNFLQNAKVRRTSLKQKLEFLRAKGLTKAEIELAFKRLNARVVASRPGEVVEVSGPAVINMDINTTETHTQWALQPSSPLTSTRGKLSIIGRIKDLFQSVTFFGVMFAVFTLFKKIIFGTRKKKKSMDESLSDMDKKVNNRISELQRDLAQVKMSLTNEQQDQTERFMLEFQQFKTDLQAIKGLLLNRKNFNAPVNISGHHHHLASSTSGGIPAWQLSTECSRHHSQHNLASSKHSDICDPIIVVEVVDEKERGLADDAGSGSGSSETEVVTKNSDSSLEIM